MQELPLVSCIMPTYNRREFIPHAIRYFIRQDYPNKELIIIDDGSDTIEDLLPVVSNIKYYRLAEKITLGEKLNMACEYATGPVIAHWDDDDWYAPWRLTYQINELLKNQTEICGINNLLYLDIRSKTGFNYIYPSNQRTWLLGSSLCYKKDFWEIHRFVHINVGMDGLFVWSTTTEHITVLPDPTFSVHIIHNDNISPKITSGTWWHPCPLEKIKELLNGDWKYYQNGNIITDLKTKTLVVNYKSSPGFKKKNTKEVKNIYACLVHENIDCVIDLVRNLHYHDPDSVILLYNGSNNPKLLTNNFPYQKYEAFIHPDSVPQKHGNLHKFALDCMEYALKSFSIDILTIVDSDQLAIRSGYTNYMSDFFANHSNIGLLSNKPWRIQANNTENFVASQAFKEYKLWKSFLELFPDGESKFVHWTFWPTTVFTSAAVHDLVRLFKENIQLQDIIHHSKIWAMEEVIFPTLIRLLGYDIAINPCSHDFMEYKRSFQIHDIDNALNKTDVYWVHPIERRYDNPLRTFIRNKFNEYEIEDKILPVAENFNGTFLRDAFLIKKINKIEGWLSDDEARLLIEYTRKACRELNGKNNIVEIGSYHGKSTILLGSILKEYQSQGKVYAIDKHDGKLGAEDQGLKLFPPSLDMFIKNITNANLLKLVEILIDRASNIKWEAPISLLFIDGLHDYANAAADFYHFSNWIEIGGYVAFHDYADYYPGVKKIVHEILKNDNYKTIQQADSLIIIQKIY